MKLFLSIVIFISFWIIRGLFYWNKAYQLKKIRKHYHSYLAKKDEVFLQKKQAVISLFKEAGVKDFSVPHYEHLSHNQAYRHSLSGFDNLNVGREDVVGIVKLKFDEAIGAFNTKMHQSYNPFFWLEFIIKLPNKILQFIQVKPSTSLLNSIQLIYWFSMILFGLHHIGIVDIKSWF